MDSVGSLLILYWKLNEHFILDIEECNNNSFEEHYNKFNKENKIPYKKVFIINIFNKTKIKKDHLIICKGETDNLTTTEITLKRLKYKPNKNQIILLKNIISFVKENYKDKLVWFLYAHFRDLDYSTIKFLDKYKDGILKFDNELFSKFKTDVSNEYKNLEIYKNENGTIFILNIIDLSTYYMVYGIYKKIYKPKLTIFVNIDSKQILAINDGLEKIKFEKIFNHIASGLIYKNKAGGVPRKNFIKFSERFNKC